MPVDTWLTRSRQAWKLKYGGLACHIGGFGPCDIHAWPVVHGVLRRTAFLVPSFMLPLTVRCLVCGLQMESCADGRALSRAARLRWQQSVQACPSCGDDGRATTASRVRWLHSDLVAERPYWSWLRLLAAAAVVLLGLGGAVTPALLLFFWPPLP